jgi:butyrate kinase
MKKDFLILVLNPGSTTTKFALFKNEKPLFVENIHHSTRKLKEFKGILDQYQFRREAILKILRKKRINLSNLDAIIGRGGLLKPVPSGTYRINKKMLKDLHIRMRGGHSSNLGGVLAYDMAKELGIPSFIVDPVVLDEFGPLARISGLPELKRKSIFHALNQKAVAKKVARKFFRKDYKKLNFIVVHLGGGISVGAHRKGRVIDVNNALDGEGPFAPKRAGTLPAGDLARLCYSKKYTLDEMLEKIIYKGGLTAHLGTSDVRKIERRIDRGDKKAKIIFQAMAYQVAKEIGSMASVLKGEIDAIILTGGLAQSKLPIKWIKERIKFLGRVILFLREEELEAMAQGALRVLRGKEKVRRY